MERVMDVLRANPIKGPVIVLLLGLALIVSLTSGRTAQVQPPQKKYFYDEKTGELVVRPIGEEAPLREGERELVEAIVVKGSGGKAEVVLLAKYTDEARERVIKKIPSEENVLMIRTLEKDAPWLSVATAEGQALLRATMTSRERMFP